MRLDLQIALSRISLIKDRIKSRSIKDYSGENVESITSAFRGDWEELHGAGMYDQNLTMSMLNRIMEAGGSSNEDFRFPLRNLKEKLEKKLLSIRHMSYHDAHTKMVKDDLDVESVLKEAKDQYSKLFDDKKWPAASHAKDSKAMSQSYGSMNKATIELKELIAAALIHAIWSPLAPPCALEQQGGCGGLNYSLKSEPTGKPFSELHAVFLHFSPVLKVIMRTCAFKLHFNQIDTSITCRVPPSECYCRYSSNQFEYLAD